MMERMRLIPVLLFNLVTLRGCLELKSFQERELSLPNPLHEVRYLGMEGPRVVQLNDDILLHLTLMRNISKPFIVSLSTENAEMAEFSNNSITFQKNEVGIAKVIIARATRIGETIINAAYCNNSSDTRDKESIRISVVHSFKITTLSIIIGWMYFAVWIFGFTPQIYMNYKRKCVVGLSFDYLGYNLTSTFAYSVYNAALFWVSSVQEEYFSHFGGSEIPVKLNDIFFVYSLLLEILIIIGQCLVYEKASQKLSFMAKVTICILWLAGLLLLIPAGLRKISWLLYLTLLSYVKIVASLLKYAPQLYMNCKRKSTIGYSIASVCFDFTGGVFSLIQMFLDSYNNNQWNAVFGNFTKFGLGLISLIVNAIFFFQHNVLYRKARENTAAVHPV